MTDEQLELFASLVALVDNQSLQPGIWLPVGAKGSQVERLQKELREIHRIIERLNDIIQRCNNGIEQLGNSGDCKQRD